MSKPRAAISVAIRIEPGLEGEEKRSIARRRAFWGISEWMAWMGRLRFWRKGKSRRTDAMEFVKTSVRVLGCWSKTL